MADDKRIISEPTSIDLRQTALE